MALAEQQVEGHLLVEEAAARCRVNAKTIRRWLAQGRGGIRAARIGRRLLIDPVSLADALKANPHPTEGTPT